MRGISIYFIALLGLLYIFISICITALGVGELQLPPIDPISIVSLVTFVILCFVAISNERLYMIVLIFIMIAFPTAANNFIPGVYWGNRSELGANIFPIITHIDIYLLLGIVRFSRNQSDHDYGRVAPFILWPTILMFLSFAINVVSSSNKYEALLLVIGGYQFRYLILIFLVLLFLKNKNIYDVALSLSFSILFLLVESSVFTLVNNLPRLESGSLAVNTFGNVVAQISLFLFYYASRFKGTSLLRNYFIGVASVGMLMSLLSGTRMSVISILLALLFIWVYKRITWSHVLKVSAFAVLMLILVFKAGIHHSLPSKYKIWEIIRPSDVEIIMNEEGASETSVERTPESSSILTRLQLFRTSFRMIEEDPLWGIGAGRWNYLKYDFGFDTPVLIDAHNGYLAMLSQYGIPTGTFMILLLLIAPTALFLKRIRDKTRVSDSGVWLMGVISLGMTISEFSNAGIFKPQVYALLTFTSIVLIAKHKKEENEVQNP